MGNRLGRIYLWGAAALTQGYACTGQQEALTANEARPALIYGRTGVGYAVVAQSLIQRRIPERKRRRGRPVFAGRVGLMVRQHLPAGASPPTACVPV